MTSPLPCVLSAPQAVGSVTRMAGDPPEVTTAAVASLQTVGAWSPMLPAKKVWVGEQDD